MSSHTPRTRGKACRTSEGGLLAAMVESGGPNAPPSEEEILELILGELSGAYTKWSRLNAVGSHR